jgi:hypothetical protein
VLAASIGFFLGVGSCSVYFYCGMMFTPQFRRQLLITDLESTRKYTFACPAGCRFSLVLGCLEDGDTRQELGGTIVVDCVDTESGGRIASLTSKNIEKANWLDSEGYSSFVLTQGGGDSGALALIPGRRYELTVATDDGVGKNWSVWFCFVTSRSMNKKVERLQRLKQINVVGKCW